MDAWQQHQIFLAKLNLTVNLNQQCTFSCNHDFSKTVRYQNISQTGRSSKNIITDI